jgi:hypothetical protein
VGWSRRWVLRTGRVFIPHGAAACCMVRPATPAAERISPRLASPFPHAEAIGGGGGGD